MSTKVHKRCTKKYISSNFLFPLLVSQLYECYTCRREVYWSLLFILYNHFCCKSWPIKLTFYQSEMKTAFKLCAKYRILIKLVFGVDRVELMNIYEDLSMNGVSWCWIGVFCWDFWLFIFLCLFLWILMNFEGFSEDRT